jgi:hypothetical protein
MRELIAPATRLHTAWLRAHAEWGPGRHEDGFGLGPSGEAGSRVLGLDRVLAVCAAGNAASVKTIERCGGVFEGIRDTRSGPALLDRALAMGSGTRFCRIGRARSGAIGQRRSGRSCAASAGTSPAGDLQASSRVTEKVRANAHSPAVRSGRLADDGSPMMRADLGDL